MVALDSKVTIDCFNKKCSLPSSIMLLMEHIWRVGENLNIFKCCHVYKGEHRTTNCLAKKGICITDSHIWYSDFPRAIRKFVFEDYFGSSFSHICSVVIYPKKKKQMVEPGFNFTL